MELTRRGFIKGAAALGIVGGAGPLTAGPLTARPRRAAHHTAPESIDNTGRQNVSRALTDWLASTGAPGDAFELRRRPDGSTGRYWIPQGIEITKPMVFDLAGCWLFTGLTLGAEDPNLEANKLAFPPLYGDQPPLGDPYFPWPEYRWLVLVGASNVTVLSSRAGARILGPARRAQLRSDRLDSPSGIAYDAAFEGQHAIRLGRYPDALCTDSTIDLTNVSLEFVHGDGVAIWRGAQRITIRGRRLGRSIVGGPASPIDGDSLDGLQGGLGGVYDRSTGLWTPELAAYPGIHHIGRQGISLAFEMSDILIDGLSLWRTGQVTFDFESPGYLDPSNPDPSTAQWVERVTIRRTETGIHHLGWITNGEGPTRDVTVQQNICYERMPIITQPRDPASTPRRKRWNILENYGGLRTGTGTVVDLGHTDGAKVRGNYHYVDSDVEPVSPGSSTGVLERGNHWPTSTTPVEATDPPPGPWL